MSDETTPDLTALLAAASPRPWRVLLDDEGRPRDLRANDGRGPTPAKAVSIGYEETNANIALIATAVNTLPTLLADLEVARECVRVVEAERDNWRDKANQAGAAYGLANQKHHEELDRANRLEGMCDRLAGRLADVHGAAEMLNRYRARAESAEAALAGLVAKVKDAASCNGGRHYYGIDAVCRKCEMPSWIEAHIRQTLPTPDREEARDE